MTEPRFAVGAGGWCAYDSRTGDPAVLIRFEPVAGADRTKPPRLVAREVRIVAEEGWRADDLRALPLGRAEALANSPAFRDRVLQTIRFESQIRADVEVATEEWLREVMPHTDPKLLARGKLKLEFHHPDRQVARRKRIDQIRRKVDRDTFYRSVANRYAQLAQSERAPAQVLAAEEGVKPATVHKWVKEARRRGLLGPGRPGRAG